MSEPRADVTPDAVVALRLAADNMPLHRDGQPWHDAAQWLHRRADAFERAITGTPDDKAMMTENQPQQADAWEYGVFRNDTGVQVGIGTTTRRVAAEDDVHAWTRDGFDVTLRRRPVAPWEPCDTTGSVDGQGVTTEVPDADVRSGLLALAQEAARKDWDDRDPLNDDADADYIAAASPAAVLALHTRLADAEARLAVAEAKVRGVQEVAWEWEFSQGDLGNDTFAIRSAATALTAIVGRVADNDTPINSGEAR